MQFANLRVIFFDLDEEKAVNTGLSEMLCVLYWRQELDV